MEADPKLEAPSSHRHSSPGLPEEQPKVFRILPNHELLCIFSNTLCFKISDHDNKSESPLRKSYTKNLRD